MTAIPNTKRRGAIYWYRWSRRLIYAVKVAGARSRVADTVEDVWAGFSRRGRNSRGCAVLAALDEVAAEAGATQAQVALAWIAAQPGVTAPIASANRIKQLEELLGAMRLDLDAAQLARLSETAR